MADDVIMAALALLVIGSVAFAIWAIYVGGMSVLAGARFERCPSCHHHGLVLAGDLHGDGCPRGYSASRLPIWHLAHQPVPVGVVKGRGRRPLHP